MPDRKDKATRTDRDNDAQYGRLIDRRRMLQLAGAGIVGSSLAVGSASAATGDHPHTIVFDGSGSSSEGTYEFGVSDSVVGDGDVGALEVDDTIDGADVVGTVTDDVDAYRFSGTLTHLDASGGVEVSISYATVSASDPDRLEILTPRDGSVEYTFEVDGSVEKVLDAGTRSAERRNDTVTENDDGTSTVTGLTGNGYGDSYDLHGPITSFQPVTGQFTLVFNGSETTVTELTGQEPSDGGSDDGSTGLQSHTLEIVTPADGRVEYALRTEGEITKVRDNGRNSAEGNDTVTQNDDGTWTVTGLTGNGYGDTFEFLGEALEFSPLSGDYTLYLDGQQVTAREMIGEEQSGHRLQIVSADDGSVDYTFSTTGRIEKVQKDGSDGAGSNDTVSENSDGTWTATGLTGNGYDDTYDFQGEVTAFEPKDGEFALYLDGQQVTAYDLTGEEPPADGGGSNDGSTAENGPIGGGRGYGRTVSRDAADYVVRSENELADALSAASSGEVVFVAGDAVIDLDSRSYTVPAGVTLASNRGIDGAPGGKLRTDSEEYMLFDIYGNARVTGLRLRGPAPGTDEGGSVSSGLVAQADGVEVDNCEVSGFVEAAVICWRGEAHVHHNYLHHNNRDGYGYGVANHSGRPVIEYNYFNYNRHSVQSSGEHEGYVCRYNHFGPTTVKHVIDGHDPGYGEYYVGHNVVEPVTRLSDGKAAEAVDVDGSPSSVVVENNWLFQSREDAYALDGVPNVEIRNNAYGENADVSYGDVIPGYDGSWTG